MPIILLSDVLPNPLIVATVPTKVLDASEMGGSATNFMVSARTF